ncbi:MAG: hypothetical protein IMZ58_11845 [Thermoplasmata archaeon]|nr:hypothetical protein [Thermoplasmata archaeon]
MNQIEQMVVPMDWAKQYGFEEAALLWWIVHWIKRSAANGKNIHDGSVWIYNSRRAWAELFPCWSEKQIYRILNNLIENGVIQKREYNQNKYDRTNWFSLINGGLFGVILKCETEVGISTVPNGTMECPEQDNQLSQTGQPIPIKKYSKEVQKEDITAGETSWRKDFPTYQKEESEAYQKFINDKEWLEKQEKLKMYQNINVLRSMEKAHEYWSSEEGWKYKARKKSAKIIWSTTYSNALSMRCNMVFDPKTYDTPAPKKKECKPQSAWEKFVGDDHAGYKVTYWASKIWDRVYGEGDWIKWDWPGIDNKEEYYRLWEFLQGKINIGSDIEKCLESLKEYMSLKRCI